jgi:SAM-dependent methyltransferase
MDARPWYQDWFADKRYLELYGHRDDEEAGQLVTLIEEATGVDKNRKVLDIACGAGRHLIAFARRGYTNLSGQDLSPTLIAQAQADAGHCQIAFSVRDMRDPIPGMYDLILNIFTSFGYFATDEENEHVILNCAAALPAGGHFVLDYLNAKHVSSHLVAHDKKQLASGEHVRLERHIHEGRVIKHITFADGAEFIESVRLYESQEIEQMFTRAKLYIKTRVGSYEGQPFDEVHSPRLILIAEKK